MGLCCRLGDDSRPVDLDQYGGRFGGGLLPGGAAGKDVGAEILEGEGGLGGAFGLVLGMVGAGALVLLFSVVSALSAVTAS